MHGRLVVAGIVLLVLHLALLGCSPRAALALAGPDAGEPMRRPVPAPETIVGRLVEAGGDVYAGDCVATVSPQDIGKVCSTFVAERGGVRAYLVGRTFSEYDRWIFVRRWGRGWRSAGTVPLDFFAPSLQIPWPR